MQSTTSIEGEQIALSSCCSWAPCMYHSQWYGGGPAPSSCACTAAKALGSGSIEGSSIAPQVPGGPMWPLRRIPMPLAVQWLGYPLFINLIVAKSRLFFQEKGSEASCQPINYCDWLGLFLVIVYMLFRKVSASAYFVSSFPLFPLVSLLPRSLISKVCWNTHSQLLMSSSISVSLIPLQFTTSSLVSTMVENP